MKKALIVSFLVFPLITIVLMGDLPILLMPCMCLVWGISVFPGFALMHVLSRLFRSPEGMFCWIPLLNWSIVMAVLAWMVSGKFELRVTVHLPPDIALLCSVALYLLWSSLPRQEKKEP